jgi:hypothetical protein
LTLNATEDTAAAVGASRLEALEREVRDLLQRGEQEQLPVMGHGEVTCVIRLDTDRGTFACKRMSPMRSREDADAHMQVIRDYIAALAEAGITTVDTQLRLLSHNNSYTIYVVQPLLDAAALGTNYVRDLSETDAVATCSRIFTLIANAVSPALAPDGQLSNWAFVGDGIQYIDVSTPFFRDASGNYQMQWKPLLDSIPRFVHGYYLKEVPKMLEHYFNVRGNILDFLANLRKERLDHLHPKLIEFVNDTFHFSPPITLQEVRTFYNEDAKGYALALMIQRLYGDYRRKLLRREHPFFPLPRIDRNLYAKQDLR